LFREAPISFGAAEIFRDEESYDIPTCPNCPEGHQNDDDIPSPLPPLIQLTPELCEYLKGIAVPYNAPDDVWENARIRFADPGHENIQMRIDVDPPYLKLPSRELNDLGLPEQELYTTGDICKLLDLHLDTFRYRLRSGIYPEPKQRAGDKRRFTKDEVKKIEQITSSS